MSGKRSRLARPRAELAKHRKEIQDLEEDINVLTERAAHLQAECTREREIADAANAMIGELRGEKQSITELVCAKDTVLAEGVREVQRLTAEVARARGMASQHSARVKELEQLFAAAGVHEKEANELRGKLAASDALLAELRQMLAQSLTISGPYGTVTVTSKK